MSNHQEQKANQRPHLSPKMFQTLLQEQEHRGLVLRWEWEGQFPCAPEACSITGHRAVEGTRLLSSIKMLTFLCISHRLLPGSPPFPASLGIWNICCKKGHHRPPTQTTFKFLLSSCRAAAWNLFRGKCECGVQLRGSCTRGTTGLQKL